MALKDGYSIGLHMHCPLCWCFTFSWRGGGYGTRIHLLNMFFPISYTGLCTTVTGEFCNPVIFASFSLCCFVCV